MMQQKFYNILEWYSGKSLEKVSKVAIPALLASEELGYWRKGDSRMVRAALNKTNVAKKVARIAEGEYGIDYKHPLNFVISNMQYGAFQCAPAGLLLLQKSEIKKLDRQLYNTVKQWCTSMAPIAELVNLLDERRPKPTYVLKTLSSLVAKNIQDVMNIDVTTIRMPEMHGEWVEFMHKGKLARVWQVIIDWPEGTKHGTSRFSTSAVGNSQCQSCGHAIRAHFNWVPLLVYSKNQPLSLWVGRDCARKLFDCEVEGDALYKR